MHETSNRILNSSSEYFTEAKDLEIQDPGRTKKWPISRARTILTGNGRQSISKTTAENLISLMKMIDPASPKFPALLTLLRYEVFDDRSGKT